MKRQKLAFIAILLLQILLLVSMAGFHFVQRNAGTEILLETEPVDPYSPLRGRYIILNYKISTLQPNQMPFQPPQNLKPNELVYVTLKKQNNVWVPTQITRQKPKSGRKQVALQGRIRYAESQNIRIDYGMESFFLSEDSANTIEKKQRKFQEQQLAAEERLRKKSTDIDESLLTPEEKKVWADRYHYQNLEREMPFLMEQGILSQAQTEQIKADYQAKIEQIKKRQQELAEKQPKQTDNTPTVQYPMQVKISVSKSGKGYPTVLYWQGKQYH